MEHSFSIEDAKKYGVEKAILLKNIRFWLEKDKANNKNKKEYTDGKEYYWTYNSASAFAKIFPYLKQRSINRWLNELVDAGVLIIGNFNKASYDKTSWYTMPDFCVSTTGQNIQSISQNGQSNVQNGQPIPDINTDINTDIYNTDIQDVPSTPKDETNRQVNLLIPLWSETNRLYKSWYKSYPQRNALKHLLDAFGYDRVSVVIRNVLPKIKGRTGSPHFYPQISSPIDLMNKWEKLEEAIIRNTKEQKQQIVI